MSAIRPLTMALVLGVASVSLAGETPPRKKKPMRDWPRIVQANNRFAWELYGELAKKRGNLFFSPSSLHTALAMTFAGARGNTGKQMHQALSLPETQITAPFGRPPGRTGTRILGHRPWPQSRVHHAYAVLLDRLRPGKKAGHELHVANALWGQKGYPWLKEFLATTRKHYGAGLREVDFVRETEPARKAINGWVEKQTRDKIKDLLAKGVLTRDTRLVLTNAIYFKGDWARQFKTDRTREAPFKLSADKSVKTPMMNQTGEFGYAESPDMQALQMPYAGEDLSMVILLPKKVDGLAAMARSLGKTKTGPGPLLKELRKQKVIVSVPKFKITSKAELSKVLPALGMKDAFTNKADLSGMNGRKDLYISAVIHQAFVDVNEEGTEAAAATAVVIERMSVDPPPVVFRADHPFLFLIRHDKTGAILFLGQVANPAE